jgi:hypothetical protein
MAELPRHPLDLLAALLENASSSLRGSAEVRTHESNATLIDYAADQLRLMADNQDFLREGTEL